MVKRKMSYKASNVPVDLRSDPNGWLSALGSDRKNGITDSSGPKRVLGWFGDRVRSSDILNKLGVEPLLLCVGRGQLRWFRHLIRKPPGSLPFEVFQAHPTGRRPYGRPKTGWRDYISHLAWERPGIPQEELESIDGERDIWNNLLIWLPPHPDL